MFPGPSSSQRSEIKARTACNATRRLLQKYDDYRSKDIVTSDSGLPEWQCPRTPGLRAKEVLLLRKVPRTGLYFD